jgi:hypothetical protein
MTAPVIALRSVVRSREAVLVMRISSPSGCPVCGEVDQDS